MRMPTSLDIAQLAGVSQSTVSRALRGDPMVNEKTRDRIRDIARRLDYTVDKNASNLRLQQTRTLALLFFEDPTSDESNINPFFLSMQGSIARVCSERGYDLLVSFQQMSRNWHAEYTGSHKADGLILLGYGDFLDYRHKLDALVQSGTRFVRWGSALPDRLGVSIGSDNPLGGRMVTEHLVAQGRRRIAFLGAPEHSPEVMERYRGYEAALRTAGLEIDPALRIDAITTEQSGHDAVLSLLDRGVAFDAAFGASDLIAIGAMRALADRGLRVPDDVAVVGFDDIAMARSVHPPLTTVVQDTRRAGRLLVEALINLIEGKPVHATRLPTHLIVRRSSVAAGSTAA
ncbi:LacI family DNA-binding transcriptional regulator [Fulvimonas sp. R45]|uniref:LacI family DNA-binding transcriptional regulator n=1 Tax=Fulvimonas sp. R45 TaxID=3045937 RepID=UPI00265E5D68|nr:LacI family DNA-binding transcriptional regulator [Fulvimonas sp. R45]MDO1527701.1 LacI family DNA-binding transcriptional regulator [Fulvimonas sp. R45]